MKKFFFIGIFLFWFSILIFIFFKLIEPPVSNYSTNDHSSFIVHQPLEKWIDPETKITFIRLPEGCFEMGSFLQEKNRGDDEGPVHKVCMDSFWISKTEITVLQFQRFVEKTRYQTQAEIDSFTWVYDGQWKKRGGFYWRNPGFDQTENHPVVHVTYQDARAMAQWMSGFKRRFLLPTESQWEYACRATSKQARFFGNDIRKTCEYANVADMTIQQKYKAFSVHPCNDSFMFTAPVGSFKPNLFGLFDILGNVWEWCLNEYDHLAYLNSKRYSQAVKNKRMPVSIRGGSWYSRPQFVRCANRDFVGTVQRRSSDLGFRLVMVID
jgi:formylglycine-generating enzyme required for sulfatase activity